MSKPEVLPSATTAGQKGLEAVRNKDYAAAIPLLDRALEDSDSPVWLLSRAQAHQQLKNYDAALHDAELAYHVAAERGSGNSRKLMIDAQYRRSVAYFKLGRYADADCCAKWSMSLAEGRPAREDDGVEKNVDGHGDYTVTYEAGVADTKGQPGQGASGLMDTVSRISNQSSTTTPKTGFESEWSRAYVWRSQILGALKKLPRGEPGWKVSVAKVPLKPQMKFEKKPEQDPQVAHSDSEDEDAAQTTDAGPAKVSDEQLKLRVDFYQTNQTVTVVLFVKDAKKADLDVKFSNKQVQISPLPRAAAPSVKAGDREATSTLVLGGEVVPSACRWSATPRKIELILKKATPGVKWGTWGKEEIGPAAAEGEEASGLPAPSGSQSEPQGKAPEVVPVAVPVAVTSATSPPTAAASVAPAYPTSSKTGPKNWDKIGEGEEGDENQDVNYFFKQLYKGATPEQQRAMVKSFVESNGTALSTDWEDVKNRKIETVPPEGVEAKKWEE